MMSRDLKRASNNTDILLDVSHSNFFANVVINSVVFEVLSVHKSVFGGRISAPEEKLSLSLFSI